MKYRWPALVLVVLYETAALTLGTMPHEHHYHDGRCEQDCAACVWQVNSTTDVPVTSAPVRVEAIIVSLSRIAEAAPTPQFIISSPSRAPPLTPA
jgi:hypothetical protein